LTFTVTLSAPSATPVIVRYFTSDGNVAGDGDYVPMSSTPSFSTAKLSRLSLSRCQVIQNQKAMRASL
jgi:hypothetical protein